MGDSMKGKLIVALIAFVAGLVLGYFIKPPYYAVTPERRGGESVVIFNRYTGNIK